MNTAQNHPSYKNRIQLAADAFSAHLNIKQATLQSGIRNITYAKQFSRLFDVWPVCFAKDTAQQRLAAKVFLLYPSYQYLLLDGHTVIGYLSTIPVRIDHSQALLPQGGYTWAINDGVKHVGRHKNAVCALAAVINPDYQKSGVSGLMINALKAITMDKGYSRLIAPVRPTQKHAYPHVSMHDYVGRKISNGLPLDPWLRSHVVGGGRIRNICTDSIVITADIATWSSWIKKPITDSYTVFEGGLSPLELNPLQGSCTYREANVWLDYQLH